MTQVIAGQGSRPYSRRMASAILRLAILIALAILPFGMAGTPALATAVDHSAMQAASGHCQEQAGKGQAPFEAPMDCTATCSALPAAPTPMPAPALKPTMPRTLSNATPFTGIVPEIATPPPKAG